MGDNLQSSEEVDEVFKRPKSPRMLMNSSGEEPEEEDDGAGIATRLRRKGYNINQNNWTSYELSQLYTFIKQFGTGDSALEFISACGLNRTYEEVAEKVVEIRELALISKAKKLKKFKRKFEEVGDGGLPHVMDQLPVEPLNRSAQGQWNAATLAVTTNFRGFNHSVIKNAISEAFSLIPNIKAENALVTESPLTKSDGLRMDIDYEKIRGVLTSAIYHAPDISALNNLEASVLLKLIDDLCIEAIHSITDSEKAVLRGFLTKLKNKTDKDNIYAYADFPCDELSATQMYIDPLRTRDLDIPCNARKITREDVEAARGNPGDEVVEFFEDEERVLNIPVVHIEPSEVNSSKYPPNSFIGAQPVGNNEMPKPSTFVVENALNVEEHAYPPEEKVILRSL